jgi:hypothetical protein
MKFDLFKKSSKIIIKAINNFHKLTENFSKEKIIHEDEDIALECWAIFDTCIKNIKIIDHKKYIFYLNTSLNRGVYRIFERHYKKHYDVVSSSNSENISIVSSRVNDNVDLIDLDLKNNFSEVEISIIEFKVSGEKLNIFLKKSNLSSNQYNEYLDSIKNRMLELYKNTTK